MADFGGEEEIEPSWLLSDNDHIHEQKASVPDKMGGSSKRNDAWEPLFGSGKIPLEGEVNDPTMILSTSFDDAEANYGSIKATDLEDKASVASGSKTTNSTKGKRRKKKNRPPPGPSSSIFDEDESKDGIENLIDDHSSLLSEEITLVLDTKPHLPLRNWGVEFFRAFSILTIIGWLGLLATQLIPLCIAGLWSQGYFDLALKVYVALFCILFVMVEVDAPVPFVRNSPLLQTFLSRGFVYSFLGLICLEEAYSERVKEIVKTHEDEFHVAWASLFMQISSWLIFSCGIGYMLMGLCCLKKLRDRLREKDRKIWKKYRREMKEWKRLNT